MNNSGGWADLWLKEALFFDIVTSLMPSRWPGMGFLVMQVLFTITHMPLAIFPLPHFFTCNSALLLFPITQNLSSNLSAHTFWHITYFTWTIFSPCSISPFKQYLVYVASQTLSSSICHYFDLTSQCVVCNGITWPWHCALCHCSKGQIVAHSLTQTYWKWTTNL